MNACPTCNAAVSTIAQALGMRWHCPSCGDVTAKVLEVSRNADKARCERAECRRCNCGGRLVRDSSSRWALRCSDCGNDKYWALQTHCITCHSDRHEACLGCGKCLPESSLFTTYEPLPAGRQRHRRADNLYCSSACRQRTYRTRKAAA